MSLQNVKPTTQPKLGRKLGLILRGLVFALIVISIAEAATFGFIIGIIPMLVLSILGFPYVIVVTFFAIKNRGDAKTLIETENLDVTLLDEKALNFQLGSQKNSFVLNFLLTLNIVFMLVICVASISNDSNWSLLVFCAAPISGIAGIGMVIYNRSSIFTKTVITAEQYALVHKIASWKLIRLNRIMSWSIWYIYGIAAVLVWVFVIFND